MLLNLILRSKMLSVTKFYFLTCLNFSFGVKNKKKLKKNVIMKSFVSPYVSVGVAVTFSLIQGDAVNWEKENLNLIAIND